MADYKTLGPRTQKGVADTTGNNPGNWTVQFTPADLNINVAFFEVYKIVVKGAPGSSFDVYVGLNQWDSGIRGDFNSWDPSETLELIPGQDIYFYWSNAATDGNQPSVTMWLRYDQSIYENQVSGRTP